jgi:hypothetical protein
MEIPPIKLTVEQWNVVLNALAAQPYAQVHQVIAAIQAQGRQQFSPGGSSDRLNGEGSHPN